MNDANNYPKFTKQMRNTHTILIPSMLDIHFRLIHEAFNASGYKTEVLSNTGQSIINEGIKYVHNDTCYPALLVIGQFIDAIKKRKDIHNIALLITQTGGGCRASNYIFLLRKALIDAKLEFIPVISLNFSNLEKDSGFKFTYKLARNLISSITISDQLMYLYNKTRSYEKNIGDSQKLLNKWLDKISLDFKKNKSYSIFSIKRNLKYIAKDFNSVDIVDTIKPKVGIVGEIYVKYSSLANNNLENLLLNEGCEISVPGTYGFLFYNLYNVIYTNKLYGGTKLKTILLTRLIIQISKKFENYIIKSIKKTKYTPMQYFKHTKTLNKDLINHGVKMGEGWLLTAEMVELIQSGYKNIVCTQPFGCMPNHICGKGVIKKLKTTYPLSNIVAIDYDPSATKVNQDNRIKLMLSIARETLDEKQIL
ncbi:MAG: 2-hydroxyglutaryl-CoA dehydratase [Anaeroplasmataceae bacterium]